MPRRRENIELFCRNLIAGRCDEQLYDIISECVQRFASFDIIRGIGESTTTEESFITSFERLCEELFNHGVGNRGRVISLLGFSLELGRYHESNSGEWYSTELLIRVLTNELYRINNFTPQHLVGGATASCILI